MNSFTLLDESFSLIAYLTQGTGDIFICPKDGAPIMWFKTTGGEITDADFIDVEPNFSLYMKVALSIVRWKQHDNVSELLDKLLREISNNYKVINTRDLCKENN